MYLSTFDLDMDLVHFLMNLLSIRGDGADVFGRHGGAGKPRHVREALDCVESAIEFCDDIVDVFDADRKTDQFGQRSALAQFVIRELRVGG